MSYIGKDFINYGCGLHLDPEVAWSRIHPSVRKNIKKTKDKGIEIRRVSGTEEELEAMRAIWYFPEDPNYPSELGPEDVMYLGYKDGELIGGTIMLAVGTHLFLNNLTANDTGKKLCMQDNLLWYAVNDLKESKFKYIDVGVSYRLNLYRFFKRWATFNYPVIFNPPPELPKLNFGFSKRLPDVVDVEINTDALDWYFGKKYTILPTVSYAEDIAKGEYSIADLTSLFPLRFGGLIKGIEISPDELWNKYSCYDHYKVEYIKKVISYVYDELDRLDKYISRSFVTEDMDVVRDDHCMELTFPDTNTPRKLRTLYKKFGIECRLVGHTIVLPFNVEMSTTDLEYMYGIYRGYLNLCSEWESTGVKGTLKE